MKIRLTLFFAILLLVWVAFFWIIRKHKSENSAYIADIRHEMTKVRILKPIIDVGYVGNDTVVSATFHVVNVGDDSLFVAFVNPDCMCTKYECSSNKVAKGDTLNVNLYVDTKNKAGKQKLVTIIKLNTEEQLHKLTLKMDVAN